VHELVGAHDDQRARAPRAPRRELAGAAPELDGEHARRPDPAHHPRRALAGRQPGDLDAGQRADQQDGVELHRRDDMDERRWRRAEGAACFRFLSVSSRACDQRASSVRRLRGGEVTGIGRIEGTPEADLVKVEHVTPSST
jgi:hypothetical protein